MDIDIIDNTKYIVVERGISIRTVSEDSNARSFTWKRQSTETFGGGSYWFWHLIRVGTYGTSEELLFSFLS